MGVSGMVAHNMQPGRGVTPVGGDKRLNKTLLGMRAIPWRYVLTAGVF
jgi:hypothetical protein